MNSAVEPAEELVLVVAHLAVGRRAEAAIIRPLNIPHKPHRPLGEEKSIAKPKGAIVTGKGRHMQEILRWCASVLTVVPGIVIAARVEPRWTEWAFVALTLGAFAWIAVAYVSKDYALLAQNVAITLINTLGIYRWLIWKGRT